MRNNIFFIISFFIISLFITVPSTNSLSDTDPCPNVTNLAELVACYDGIHSSDKVWDCTEFSPEGGTSRVNEDCRNAFQNQLYSKFDEMGYHSWNSLINGRADARRQIMDIFDVKVQDRFEPENTPLLTTTPTPTITPTPTVTPSPTPTLAPNSAYFNDPCLSRLQDNQIAPDTNNCFGKIQPFVNCYRNDVGPENKLWACEDVNGNTLIQSECARIFGNRTINEMKRILINSYSNNQCTIDSPEVLTEEVLNGWLSSSANVGAEPIDEQLIGIYLEQNTNRSNTGITPTPGYVPEEYLDDIERTTTDENVINEAWETFNCGFANGAYQGKDACCSNTLRDTDFELNTGNASTAEVCNSFASVLGLCQFDFSQFAKDKLKDYIANNDTTNSLNQLLQDEGEIPECFVGTCNDEGKCVPEEGAEICNKYINEDDSPNAAAQCQACFEKNREGSNTKWYYTALGCIDTSFEGIVSAVFSFGIGIAGTGTLLCIIYAAFLMQTSQGNPERIQKAQENITACITGLILIIFSILLLRIIGVDILRIPGFSV